MRNGSPSLHYCIKILRRGPDSSTQFIDILIETKHNDVVIMLLTTTETAIFQCNKKNVKQLVWTSFVTSLNYSSS